MAIQKANRSGQPSQRSVRYMAILVPILEGSAGNLGSQCYSTVWCNRLRPPRAGAPPVSEPPRRLQQMILLATQSERLQYFRAWRGSSSPEPTRFDGRTWTEGAPELARIATTCKFDNLATSGLQAGCNWMKAPANALSGTSNIRVRFNTY